MIIIKYSLFERFLQNMNNDEEYMIIYFRYEKLSTPENQLSYTFVEGTAIKDIFFSLKNSDTDHTLLPIKILQKIGEYIDTGFYFSKNLFVRREIW